jgi:hypothetical protein
MRIKIPICPDTQVSRRLTCLSMAAYSRGDMRRRLVHYKNNFEMRIKIRICPDMQVSRRLICLSMAAYSRGDMTR